MSICVKQNARVKKNFKPFLIILPILAILLSSCNGQIKISVDKAGNADIEFASSMGTALENLIVSLSSSDNPPNSSETETSETETPFFDSSAIKNSLTHSGLKNIQVKTPKRTSVDFSAQLPDLKNKQNILAQTLKFTGSSLSFTISPEIAFQIKNSMDEDVQSYIDLLMAPVFSGESMQLSEYTELVSSVYGQQIADELLSSRISIHLSIPGKSKTFEVPLTQLLTVSDKLEFYLN